MHNPARQQSREQGGFADADINVWLAPGSRYSDSDAFKREILAHHTGLQPSELVFRTGEHGKPELDQNKAPFRFNLSHSHDWIVCAVSQNADVGIDIEYLGRETDLLRLGRRFYHPQEFEALNALPAPGRADYFYDLWTLKEASVKARGGALAPSLPEREFDLVPGQPTPALIQALPGQTSLYFRCLLDPLPDYRVALCSAVLQPSIRLQKWQPGGSWKEMAVELRASSGPYNDA